MQWWAHSEVVRTAAPFSLPMVPVLGRHLAALGIGPDRLERAVHDGRLIRVRHGVYLAACAWPAGAPDQHLLRAAAECLAQPRGVVSHRSAALAWGLPLPAEDWACEPVWLSVDHGRSEAGPRLRQVVAALPAHHLTSAALGFPITSVARTAVDVAEGQELPDALLILDAALRKECAGLSSQLRRRELANPALVVASRQPCLEAARTLGCGDRLVRAISIADPIRESPIESLTFGHLVLAGLPLPICQHPISTPLGTFYPDFYWPEQRLIGEADGRLKYLDAAAITMEKQREQVLRDLGYGIVRWLGSEIHTRPDLVLARIARALG